MRPLKNPMVYLLCGVLCSLFCAGSALQEYTLCYTGSNLAWNIEGAVE